MPKGPRRRSHSSTGTHKRLASAGLGGSKGLPTKVAKVGRKYRRQWTGETITLEQWREANKDHPSQRD